MKIIEFIKDYPHPFYGKTGWKKGDRLTLDNWRAKRITQQTLDFDLLFETGERRWSPIWAICVEDLGNFHGRSKVPCYVCCRKPETRHCDEFDKEAGE